MGLGISTGCTQVMPDDTRKYLEESGIKETFKGWTVRDVNEALIATEGFRSGEMKCGWQEFFHVCQDIKDRKDRASLLRQRDSMHPACLSYAMVSENLKDEEDETTLRKIEGVKEEEEEKEEEQEEKEEEEKDVQEDVFEMNEDLDAYISENEEEDDIISSSQTQSSKSNKPTRIPSDDVYNFSPIFFGYSTISSHEFDSQDAKRVKERRNAEESFEESDKDAQNIKNKIKTLETEREEWTSRQDKALQDRKKRRERERKDIENSFHAKKREVGEDELLQIKKQYENEIKAFEETITNQDNTSQKTRERKLKSFSKQIQELELALSKKSSSNSAILSRPRGNKLCEIYEEKLDKAALEWAERKKELKEKQMQIEEGGSSRGVKIMMKSAIEKCEKAIFEASEKMEKLRKSQELSQSLARREAPFAALFEPLIINEEEEEGENENNKPHTLMVFSTIIMFCGDSLRHKLDWFFWRFSETQARTAKARSKPRSMRDQIEQQDATSSIEDSRCSSRDIESLLFMTTRALELIGGVSRYIERNSHSLFLSLFVFHFS